MLGRTFPDSHHSSITVKRPRCPFYFVHPFDPRLHQFICGLDLHTELPQPRLGSGQTQKNQQFHLSVHIFTLLTYFYQFAKMAGQVLQTSDLSTAFKNYGMNFTPESFNFGNTISPEAMSFSGSPSPSTCGGKREEKSTKKRRSWGQQLPTPTTNLPPR